jgi:iron complex transport system substrate-binding protein
MRKHILALAICVVVVLAMLASGCTTPTPGPAPAGNETPKGITIVDSNGNAINLSGIADRIIATNSDCAEVLIAIGAKDRIVGVSNTVKKNPALGPLLENVTDIGSWDSPNMEQIAMLQPDVVIVYATWKPKNADQFATLNATILPLDCGNMKTVASDIQQLGKLTGREAKAGEFADFIGGNIDLVMKKVDASSYPGPDVYWEYNSEYSTAGNGSGADYLITAAGGRNIAGDLNTTYPKVNSEFVVEKGPGVIVKTFGYGQTAQNITNLRNTTMARTGLSQVAAVKDGKVYVMSSTITYGPKGSIGLLYLAKVLHPGLFGDVDPAAALDRYAEKYVPGTNQPNLIYPVPA